MKIRPKGILIISILWFIAGVLAFSILGISIISPGTHLLDLLSASNFPPGTSIGIVVILILILGLIVLSTGWGLLKGQKWAWWLTVILFAVGGIADAIRAAFGSIEGIVGVLIVAGFLFYLTRPGVQKFFESPNKEK